MRPKRTVWVVVIVGVLALTSVSGLLLGPLAFTGAATLPPSLIEPQSTHGQPETLVHPSRSPAEALEPYETELPNWTMIAVGAGADQLAYDSAKGETFVANYYSDNVSVVNDSLDVSTTSIPVPGNPYGVAYDSGQGEIFVSSHTGSTVSVINDTTDSIVATIQLPQTSPWGLAYDRGRGEVFVLDGNPSYPSEFANVTVISDSTDQIVANITVGDGARSIAYDSGRGELFVANAVSDFMSVINDTTNSVVANLSVGYTTGVAYAPTDGEIFATLGNNTMVVISDSTDQVVARLIIGSGSEGVAFDPATNIVYASAAESGQLTVVDAANDEDLATLSGFGNAIGVSYDPIHNTILVASGSVVIVVPCDLTAYGSATPSSGAAPLSVEFGAAAAGGTWNYTGWNWSFGDGTGSILQDPVHEYDYAGTYFAVATVTDSANAQAASLDIETVVSGPPGFGLTLTATGTQIDLGNQVTISSRTIGGAGPFSYAWGAFPSGAGCSAGTTYVTCRPVEANLTFNATLEVTDAYGAMANATSMNVTTYPQLTYSFSLSNATPSLGEPIVLRANASGGLPPYAFDYSNLPPGCESTGGPALACIPTQAGTYSIDGAVVDSTGWSVGTNSNLTVEFNFTIVAPTTTLAGSAITIQILVTGASGPLSYSYAGLPPGCDSLNSSRLTCTPTQAGLYSVKATVRDPAGYQETRSAVLRVTPTAWASALGGTVGYVLAAAVVASAAVGVGLVVRWKRGTVSLAPPIRAGTPYGGYRAAAERPEGAGAELLSDGESDPLSDLL